jgi:hypothetical protein
MGDLPPTTSTSWSSWMLLVVVVEVHEVLTAKAWALVDDDS